MKVAPISFQTKIANQPILKNNITQSKISFERKFDFFKRIKNKFDDSNKNTTIQPIYNFSLKTPKEVSAAYCSAKLMKEEAVELRDRVVKQSDFYTKKAEKFYLEDPTEDQNFVGRIIETDGSTIIEKSGNDSTLYYSFRRNGVLREVADVDEYGKNIFEYDRNGNLANYREDVEQMKDGTVKTNLALFFKNPNEHKGQLKSYVTGLKNYPDGSISADKQLFFEEQGKMARYIEYSTYKRNGDFSKEKQIIFNKDETPKEYSEGIESTQNHCTVDNKLISCENGTWTAFAIN